MPTDLRFSLRRLALLVAVALAGLRALAADGSTPAVRPPVDRALHDTIAALDEKVFAAFNAGDLEAQKPFFDPALEFYHDKGGFSRYDQFLETSRRLFARDDRPRRTLVPGTLEVFPIKDFGAVQLGRHRFCVTRDGVEECSVFRFVHVWQLQDGKWKITRVISYDH